MSLSNHTTMKKILIYIWSVAVFTGCLLDAAQVRNVVVTSTAMNKQINNVVITPDRRSSDEKYPVVYLLHGHGMVPADWLEVQPLLPRLADDLRLIIVCPDGGNNWYVDSPEDSQLKYETYVTKELVEYVDANMASIKDRRGRALCGLSMGGYGALRLAILHQDQYSAAGSMSGLVDFAPFPNRWSTQRIFGKAEEHADRLREYSVVNLIHFIRPGLDIMIDCGTDDFFHEINENLHRSLMERHIPHTYTSFPGTHDYAYWNNAILHQFIFLSRHFADADFSKAKE